MKFLNKIIVNDRINTEPIAGDIPLPVNGDIWYNSTLGKFRKYENGIATNLDTVGSGGGSTPRYAAYTTATSTDANLVVAPGTSYTLPAATLTANRTIDLTAINAEADYIEIDNQETGFTWSFIGGIVLDAYGNSVTILMANTRYILRRTNNQIKIFN